MVRRFPTGSFEKLKIQWSIQKAMPKALQNLDLHKKYVCVSCILSDICVKKSAVSLVTFFEQTNPFSKTANHAK